jgi:hypothetical protein
MRMTLAVAVILRCRSEAEASKGGGVPMLMHPGRASFEARKRSHLRMTVEKGKRRNVVR